MAQTHPRITAHDRAPRPRVEGKIEAVVRFTKSDLTPYEGFSSLDEANPGRRGGARRSTARSTTKTRARGRATGARGCFAPCPPSAPRSPAARSATSIARRRCGSSALLGAPPPGLDTGADGRLRSRSRDHTPGRPGRLAPAARARGGVDYRFARALEALARDLCGGPPATTVPTATQSRRWTASLPPAGGRDPRLACHQARGVA
jgi:hypothetical protein